MGNLLHISNHPQASKTRSLLPNGTCGLQAARPQSQGPLQTPAGSQWAQRNIGRCGLLLGRRKQKGVQGNFIQLEIHLDRGPSPLVLPLAGEVIKATGVPKLAALRHCV